MRTPVVAAIAVIASSLVTGAGAVNAPTIEVQVADLTQQVANLRVAQERGDADIVEGMDERIDDLANDASAAINLGGCVHKVEAVRSRVITVNGERIRVLVHIKNPRAKDTTVYWLATVKASCTQDDAKPGRNRNRSGWTKSLTR